jgi:hypothetical protein
MGRFDTAFFFWRCPQALASVRSPLPFALLSTNLLRIAYMLHKYKWFLVIEIRQLNYHSLQLASAVHCSQ